MKVLHIVPSNENAGPVNVVKYLTEVNNTANIEFSVLCLRKKTNYFFKNCKTYFLPEDESFVSVFIWVLRFMKDNSFDVCHSHGFFPDLYCFVFSCIRLLKLKSMSTVHNYPELDYPMEYGKLRGKIIAKFHYFFLRRLTLVVGCSDSVRNHLITKNMFSKSVRNGVPQALDSVFYTENGSCVKHESANRVYLLFLGRLIKRKNFSDLARVFLNANQAFHDRYHLTVYGNGHEFEFYKSLFLNFTNVEFLGSVDNPDFYISKCDLLVSTSLAEGLPLSVLEAVQARKKVLLSNIEPHVELKGVLGDIVECYQLGSECDMKDKLQKLVDCKIEDYARSSYLTSATRMLNEYVATYKSL